MRRPWLQRWPRLAALAAGLLVAGALPAARADKPSAAIAADAGVAAAAAAAAIPTRRR